MSNEASRLESVSERLIIRTSQIHRFTKISTNKTSGQSSADSATLTFCTGHSLVHSLLFHSFVFPCGHKTAPFMLYFHSSIESCTLTPSAVRLHLARLLIRPSRHQSGYLFSYEAPTVTIHYINYRSYRALFYFIFKPTRPEQSHASEQRAFC